jgi:hypothetical protein
MSVIISTPLSSHQSSPFLDENANADKGWRTTAQKVNVMAMQYKYFCFQRRKENIAIFGDTGGWQKEMSIVKKEEEMRKGKNDEQKGMA